MIESVHIIFSTHLDLGFTDPPDRVAWKMKEHLDTALDLCAAHEDFNYTVETAWILRQWLDRTDDSEIVERMAERIRQGRIEVCGVFATQHNPLCGPEDLSQVTYEARRLQDALGIEIVTAMQNDVPGYCWAYPQILRGSGIRYFFAGINTLLGGGIDLPESDLPFLWEGIDGSRILTWIQDGYCLDIHAWEYFRSIVYGRPPEEAAPAFDAYIRHLESRGYRHRTACVLVVPADNLGPLDSLPAHRFVRAWNAEGRFPRLVVSTPRRFFEQIEAEAHQIPVHRGDWIPSAAWDLVKPRGPRAAGDWRRTQARLPALETLWAFDALLGGKSFPRTEVNRAYDGLLRFGEHSAPEGPGHALAALTRREIEWSNYQHFDHAHSAWNLTEGLMEVATLQIARWMAHDADAVIVFNPTSWPRTDVVRVRSAASGSDTFAEPRRFQSLVDQATGETVPCDNDEMSESGGDARGPDRQPCVSFVARDVPALGYRVYHARHAESTDPAAHAVRTVADNACVDIENDGVRVVVDGATGAILSIRDKELDRELTAPRSATDPAAVFNGLAASEHVPPHDVGIRVVEGNTFRRCEIRRPGTWFPETDVRIAHDTKRVDVRNVFDRVRWRRQNPDADRWIVYTRFPLGVDPAATSVAISGPVGFRRIPDDLLPGTPQAPWPLTSFAVFEEGDVTILFACSEDSLIHPAQTDGPGFEVRAATIDQRFRARPRAADSDAFVCTEPEDGGAIVRSYAITAVAAPWDPVVAHRFGWGHRQPMLGAYSVIACPDNRPAGDRPPRAVLQVDNRAVPGSSGPPAVFAQAARSLLEVDDDGVACMLLRRSLIRGQDFFVLRIQEIAGRPPRDVRVTPAPELGVAKAALADITERPVDNLPVGEDGAIRFALGPFQTATVALWIAPAETASPTPAS